MKKCGAHVAIPEEIIPVIQDDNIEIHKTNYEVQPLLFQRSDESHAKIRRCQSLYLTCRCQNGTFLSDRVRYSSSSETLISKRTHIERMFRTIVGRKISKADLAPSVPLFEEYTAKQNDNKILHQDANPNLPMDTIIKKPCREQPARKKENTTLNIQPDKVASMVKYSGLRKSETVLASSPAGYIDPIKPLNRLRHSFPASNFSSACKSLLSLNMYDMTYSYRSSNKKNITDRTPGIPLNYKRNDGYIICKLCLVEVISTTKIKECSCVFCTECLKAYVEFEISHGAYEISCPDAQCPYQGSFSLEEIKLLGNDTSLLKFERYRLNHEIDVDKKRAWCPRAGCDTVCFIGSISPIASSLEQSFNPDAIRCPTCHEEFCSACLKSFHPGIGCDQSILTMESTSNMLSQLCEDGLIKNCPMCAVLIEKDNGCAQMMCKRCKHVFCWYCLSSLDDDFLLRHYDKGPCKNRLGHSRASVLWHRVQVIGIFAGFGVLLLAASPLLLLAAPCIICCKCKACNGSTTEDQYAVNCE